MVRDSRYKLVTSHKHRLWRIVRPCTPTPAEYDNRWHDPSSPPCATTSSCKALEALALSTNPGPL